MSDIVDPKTRSRMMANIKGKNTKPEMAIRSALHRMGYRFRLHRKDLPGKPDIVLPKHRAVLFVNGCFWHGHFCSLFKWPKTREEFWREKILSNKKRDQQNIRLLTDKGWRVCIVWECSIRKRTTEDVHEVIESLTKWIEGSKSIKEITL
ncbi:DNA mismatch endonuclease Vsr [Marinobacter nauticus ATCC 49840]|nr:very short patch repair endonuclease [Marinobacter nauticus]CCG97164.1 DNA mismatch endonuclease Vsr [Marinobacter nauticus ATCC 49840]